MKDGTYLMVEAHNGEYLHTIVVCDQGEPYQYGPISHLGAHNNGATITPLFLVENKEAFAIDVLIQLCENVCKEMVDHPERDKVTRDFIKQAKVARAFLDRLEEYKS